jgi:hypothetical protein
LRIKLADFAFRSFQLLAIDSFIVMEPGAGIAPIAAQPDDERNQCCEGNQQSPERTSDDRQCAS